MATADEPLGALARDLRAGDRAPIDYLDRLRERFAAVEPTIRAFLDEDGRWERLATAAGALERRHPDPGTRPPLYGVPAGVKDIFHVDGFETRAGSDVPPEALAGPEAPVVTTLRDAGALVAGKTVTTEFAHAVPGPTRNPHDPEHTPGGSSSGSAAAVAAGLCPLALGTQTVGSVTRPAAFCGIVGVKPSYGRVPTAGVVPLAPSVDTVGYFTQDLPGARLAASVLCEEWRDEDPPGEPAVGATTGPYVEQATETGRAQFRDHVDSLTDAGLDVRRVDPFDDVATVNDRHDRLEAAEAALSHADWYAEYGDRYADATAELVEDGRDVRVGDLAEARRGRSALRERVHESMADHGVDVLVSPAAPGPAPEGLDSTGDPVMNAPWTHAGLPTVTLPASVTGDGLPVGLQCTARLGADEWLLGWCSNLRTALCA